jgi:hypothetical protein
MRLSERVAKWLEAHPVGVMLDDVQVQNLALQAAVFYSGYSDFEHDRIMLDAAMDAGTDYYPNPTSLETCVTDSDWAIIRPLFALYVERENAIFLEASRGLGVDVFGRSVSEVSQEITTTEAELPHKAFMQIIIRV